MPSPRIGLRARHGWRTGHLHQLAEGMYWPFLGGWGELCELPEDVLRETVADMLACWQQEQHRVEALLENPQLNRREAWFAKYADDPERLIQEQLANPQRELHLRDYHRKRERAHA